MTRLAMALLTVLCVTACGKVGGAKQVGPADQITYPKTYPTQ